MGSVLFYVKAPEPEEPPYVGPIYGPETFDGTIGGLYGKDVRIIIPASDIMKDSGGVAIKLTLAGLGWSTSMDNLTIGHQAVSGDPWDYDGNEINTGNLSPWPAGGTTIYGINLTVDPARAIIVGFSLTSEDEIPTKGGSSGHIVYTYTGPSWDVVSTQHSLVAEIDIDVF